jgi:lactate permease
VYTQVLEHFGSLGLTALVAALPLIVLFILLGVLRMTAWKASLVALLVSLVVAVAVYSMPVGQALLSGTLGAVFGFFPILWIVINAIWVYNMTVETGHFDVLQRSFARVSSDQRIQAVIIAFCFGALLEALAGFGTPVAITSVMLIALGLSPMKSAVVALVANTAPVAFGALAAPITALSTTSGLPVADLGAMTGRQTPVLAVFVPLVLVFLVDGKRGVRATLPATLACGFTFAVTQYLASNFLSVPLTDIVAALFSAGAVVAVLRVWSPSEPYTVEHARAAAAAEDAAGSGLPAAGGVTTTTRTDVLPETRAHVLRAYAPYLVIIVVFSLAQIPAIKSALGSVTQKFGWPGLDVRDPAGKPLSLETFKFDWLAAAGTLLLISGLITIPLLGISPARALARYGATYVQLKFAIITVMSVLALAYVMNASGQTASLGLFLAGAGGLFALIAPVLGWLGVAVTGSDTSANTLFGALQVSAANQVGMSPILAAAANGAGGVLGKMVSPQNLAIAAGAVGLAGREGDIFRKVVGWSLGFLAFMCVLVYLQSTPVLSWMVV